MRDSAPPRCAPGPRRCAAGGDTATRGPARCRSSSVEKAMLTLPVGANETDNGHLGRAAGWRRLHGGRQGWPSGPRLQIRSWRIGGKHAAFSRQPGRRQIGLVADAASDPRGEHARGRRAIVNRSISSASPSPDSPTPIRRLAWASAACSGKGQRVRSSTLSNRRTCIRTRRPSSLKSKPGGPFAERIAHEARRIDRPEHAAPMGRQGLLAARVGGRQAFAVAQRIQRIDRVHEQHPSSASRQAAAVSASHSRRAGRGGIGPCSMVATHASL